jgi:hypothetical protein
MVEQARFLPRLVDPDPIGADLTVRERERPEPM